jgi:hypothetical protein
MNSLLISCVAMFFVILMHRMKVHATSVALILSGVYDWNLLKFGGADSLICA